MFTRLRAAGSGERAVLEDNFFVEVVLPAGVVGGLSRGDHDRYRAPFHDPVSRAPILQWVREIPIAGAPADVAHLIRKNLDALRDPALPTLLLYGTPGAIIGPAEIAWCSTHGRSMTFAAVGAGTHFLPENRPTEIVRALAEWLTVAT